MGVIQKDLGVATAYGYAKAKGYTGTEEEFATLMASYATVAEEAGQSAEAAAESATNASTSAETATTKAGEAETSAGQAATSAESALASAQAAGQAVAYAERYSETAGTAAESASASADSASESASGAGTSKLDAEAYAVGKRDGTDVPDTDPAFQNNSKYYSGQAATSATAAQNAADLAQQYGYRLTIEDGVLSIGQQS